MSGNAPSDKALNDANDSRSAPSYIGESPSRETRPSWGM